MSGAKWKEVAGGCREVFNLRALQLYCSPDIAGVNIGLGM